MSIWEEINNDRGVKRTEERILKIIKKRIKDYKKVYKDKKEKHLLVKISELNLLLMGIELYR